MGCLENYGGGGGGGGVNNDYVETKLCNSCASLPTDWPAFVTFVAFVVVVVGVKTALILLLSFILLCTYYGIFTGPSVSITYWLCALLASLQILWICGASVYVRGKSTSRSNINSSFFATTSDICTQWCRTLSWSLCNTCSWFAWWLTLALTHRVGMVLSFYSYTSHTALLLVFLFSFSLTLVWGKSMCA